MRCVISFIASMTQGISSMVTIRIRLWHSLCLSNKSRCRQSVVSPHPLTENQKLRKRQFEINAVDTNAGIRVQVAKDHRRITIKISTKSTRMFKKEQSHLSNSLQIHLSGTDQYLHIGPKIKRWRCSLKNYKCKLSLTYCSKTTMGCPQLRTWWTDITTWTIWQRTNTSTRWSKCTDLVSQTTVQSLRTQKQSSQIEIMNTKLTVRGHPHLKMAITSEVSPNRATKSRSETYSARKRSQLQELYLQ